MRTSTHRASHRAPLVLWPLVRGAGHAEAWRGAATTRGRTPTGKGALEVTGPRVGCPQQPPATHTHISTHGMHAAGERWRACGTPRDQTGQSMWDLAHYFIVGGHALRPNPTSDEVLLVEPGCVANLGGMRSCGSLEKAWPRRATTTHRAGGCDGQRGVRLGRQCVISRVVITTMLFESIIICRCCTPAPVWRAGGVAGADGLIRASTRLERTQDMHNGHCAWRSVRCARVRTEHHTARPLVLWPPYVRGAGHAEAWRGAATTRGRTPTGKGALEVTGPGSGARSSPRHTHTSLHTGCMRRESAGGRVEHRAIRQGKGCFQAYWGDNTLYHKDSKSLREPGEGLAEESYHHTPLGRQCVISRVVITTMLFESIIICRCCTPAPVWRAGGVAGADGLIRASTRLERTQDMHNGHCAWRSVRCARVRTEHHTARPLVLWPPYVRGAGHAEAWRGAATTRGRTPTGKGALEVTGPGSGARSSPPPHTHTSLHTGCMRRESAGGRVEHRAIRQGKGCFQAYWGDNTLYHKDSKSLREPGEGLAEESYHHTPLGRQCVISRVVITTMLFESIIICRCCTPAPVWRAGGVAGADGLIRASTRLERTQDMHNGHCAWRSVRCARVRTEHHTARPLVLWPPYVRGAGHAEAWRGAATTRGRTPTGKGALEVTGPGSGARSSPRHTHTSLHTGCMRRESAGGRVEHRAIRQGKGCFQAYWGDNTLYHKDSKSLREPGEGLAEESYHHTPLGRQCVISRVVITTMLFESIIICRCCTPAPVWRAGGVAGADGLIRASTRLERTQDMHNGHCAWRSVRCARVRTEHHTARPLVLWPPYVRGAGHAEAWRGAATTRGRTPTGKGALEVTGPGSGARSSPATHTHISTHGMHAAGERWRACGTPRDQTGQSMWDLAHYFIVGGHALRPNPTSDEVLLVEPGCVANLGGMRSCGSLEKAWPRRATTTHRAGGCDGQRGVRLGRQCVISRVVITTMLFESIIICRCCTPAPVWRAGGVAGADGLIRASTRLERTQDMHNGHCAWRSVRCARVRTEHHTARPLVLWPPYVRGAGHAEAWRGAATTRGRTPTGKGALEVTGPGSGARSSPRHTHTSLHTGCMRRESAGGRVEHRAIRQGKGCFQAYWGDNTLYHKDSNLAACELLERLRVGQDELL
eukprot:gene164-92_t